LDVSVGFLVVLIAATSDKRRLTMPFHSQRSLVSNITTGNDTKAERKMSTVATVTMSDAPNTSSMEKYYASKIGELSEVSSFVAMVRIASVLA
jgi:hypothetical protein